MPRGRLYTFTVEGKGYFPFDMLRSDRCWPKAESTDVIALAVGCGPASRERLIEKRTVTLESYGSPNVDRWRSFGWRVVNPNLTWLYPKS